MRVREHDGNIYKEGGDALKPMDGGDLFISDGGSI